MSESLLILASGSAIRARILANAGLDFSVIRPAYDEEAAKAALRAQNRPAPDIAAALALGKALACDAPDSAVVIGADQVLEFAGAVLDKVPTRDAARDRLWEMRGREHVLWSAWALVRHGQALGSGIGKSTLRMRKFTPEFLENFLENTGDSLTRSVGAYEYEGMGAQLFEEVRGDYFAILGLPLLPLLAKLREFGVLAE